MFIFKKIRHKDLNMNRIFENKSFFFSILLVLFGTLSTMAQVVFTTNLLPITTDVCAGTYRKIGVVVTKGTCSDFAGNVNSAVFTWQIESSPGVWQNINAYNVPGITYANTQTINGAGTVIAATLSVKSAKTTLEVILPYRVLVQGSGGCPVAISQTETVSIKQNRWTGNVSSSWDDPANWSCDNVPGANLPAIVAPGINPAVVSSSAVVGDLLIETGGNLTVDSGANITVNGPVKVQGTGSFTLQNNANLLQGAYLGVNTGAIKVNRNSSALKRLDYTLWSSPVASQNLLAFSPQTVTNRFYVYNSATNVYNTIAPASNSFQIGKGYMIRMPDNHPTTATVWNGQFTGVPNNGTITVPIYNGGAGLRISAIGNPYPSPIKLNSFISTNTSKITGTLYFWRKTNNTATEPGYCTWTTAGFVSNGEAQVFDPNGILRTGQGFLVEAVNTQTSVVFNNTMRTANNANQFFRNDDDVNNRNELNGDRIWLNVSNVSGADNQMLLGYFADATYGVDYGIDGKAIEDAPVALTMDIAGADYLIQGRPAFDVSDNVPLRFKTTYDGAHAIAIDHVDGVFTGSQGVFLKDNLLNVTHDLKTASYSFVSNAGTFSDRFEIVYQNTVLGNNQSSFNENTVVVFKDRNGVFNINANGLMMGTVEVYDARGRKLIQKSINDSKVLISEIKTENTLLLVKIVSSEGIVINKKIIF